MFAQLFNVISPPAITKDEDDLDNSEYRHIGPWMGNFLTTLRLSLGDFNFDVLNEPDTMLTDACKQIPKLMDTDGCKEVKNPHALN